ncbi:hypothetical protein P7K49_025755 [Saguinus oedipus]|uniref:Uncharacterized protein n=1 Tax=Saguinus oedipus TaxID=9490 RepID=A0ABQ9UI52_SAGOE|nr:hypothetical protein P7K49_025755 [Saguinus oedipus]
MASAWQGPSHQVPVPCRPPSLAQAMEKPQVIQAPEKGSAEVPVACAQSAHRAQSKQGVAEVVHTVSKQRKNVISCVTVHDSPYSDSSSNTSPYSVQQRAGHNNANAFDTKGSLENHCTGNPRTIIVPPLKTQASEVLVECDSLVPGNLGPGQDRNASLESSFHVFLLLETLLYGS